MMNALTTYYISFAERVHAFYNIMNLTDMILQFNIAANAMMYN
jgi:hypothetical protein